MSNKDVNLVGQFAFLSNYQKAFLTFRWFEENFSPFVEHLKRAIEIELELENNIRDTWPSNFFVTADFWFEAIRRTKENIRRFPKTAELDKEVILLFNSGQESVFVVMELLKFTSLLEDKETHKKFIDAVNLFWT